MGFYGLVGNSKTMLMSLLGKGAVDGGIVQLHYLTATIADQQLHRVGMVEVQQKMKALSDSTLWAKPCSSRKSSAR